MVSSRGQVAADLHVGVDHLLQARRLSHDQIVGQKNRDRLVADQATRAPHGVAQAKRLLLANIGDLTRLQHHVGHGPQFCLFATSVQDFGQLAAVVEMVLDRGLAPSGDEYELLDPGLPRLFDRVLDQRLVDDGQHFLGHGLGRRQEPGTQATDRKDGSARRTWHEISISLGFSIGTGSRCPGHTG